MITSTTKALAVGVGGVGIHISLATVAIPTLPILLAVGIVGGTALGMVALLKLNNKTNTSPTKRD